MAPSFGRVVGHVGLLLGHAEEYRFEVLDMHVGHKARGAWMVAPVMVLMVVVSGCRSHRADTAPPGRVDTPQASAEKVGTAGGTIVAECGKVSFDNVSEGLIAAEPGLHEDVFDLRDTVSYRAVPFGLYEAIRLEALLQQDATPSSHSRYSAQQMDCIAQFAAHLKTLTAPLVQADAEQKQLDVSAFDKASREAQEQAEQQAEQEQKAMEHASPPQQ